MLLEKSLPFLFFFFFKGVHKSSDELMQIKSKQRYININTYIYIYNLF